MITRWGRDLDPDNPLPEHPRPQLVRDTWTNLNGRWEYAFGDEEIPGTWSESIVVPFSPECELSGVGRQLQPDEWLWYRRSHIKAPPGERVLLHFGAVDQSCTVWVNGAEVGSHTGGYLPFTFEITDALVQGTQEIVVRVRDISETGPHARGKQRLDRGRIWYTAQSGIWQTVWLEAVPVEYVESVQIEPDLDRSALAVTAATIGTSGNEVLVRVLDRGELVAEASGPACTRLIIAVPDARQWTPADPFLYDLEITCGKDRVTSYAAMRSFGIGKDSHGRRRFLLNGEPFQHTGVLDQGYWPDGLMTAPSDDAVVHDLSIAKDLGFTMIRKHAKIEPLRWYHHCDRLGLLVWQDMVNGGGRYRELVTALPARWPIRISDHRYSTFFRADAQTRAEFRDEVRQTVELLRNTPSVAVWTPFNEGWGQFDANAIAAEVAALDPTRPVNHVSGWVDQGGGDVKSFHSYLRPFRLRRRRSEKRVYALTEYGGYSLSVEGHVWDAGAKGSDGDQWTGYRHCATAEELASDFVILHHRQIAPGVRDGLAATVYTQLTDVEGELNGLVTWDREALKIPASTVRRALASLS